MSGQGIQQPATPCLVYRVPGTDFCLAELTLCAVLSWARSALTLRRDCVFCVGTWAL